jgi:hypothetical protein
MANSTATPTLLTSPGYLFWAPLASTLPTNTVAGSVFTDSWPVAWVNLGATDDGSTISYESKIEAVKVAEFFDPIQWVTTGREGGIAFALASWTLNNLKRVLNGGSLAVVSGTGATALNKYEPPAPGSEVRCMIGWESLDATVRFIAYQCFQGGKLEIANKPAPNRALLPAEFKFEIPTSPNVPFSVWSAGAARVGS